MVEFNNYHNDFVVYVHMYMYSILPNGSGVGFCSCCRELSIVGDSGLSLTDSGVL